MCACVTWELGCTFLLQALSGPAILLHSQYSPVRPLRAHCSARPLFAERHPSAPDLHSPDAPTPTSRRSISLPALSLPALVIRRPHSAHSYRPFSSGWRLYTGCESHLLLLSGAGCCVSSSPEIRHPLHAHVLRHSFSGLRLGAFQHIIAVVEDTVLGEYCLSSAQASSAGAPCIPSYR